MRRVVYTNDGDTCYYSAVSPPLLRFVLMPVLMPLVLWKDALFLYHETVGCKEEICLS